MVPNSMNARWLRLVFAIGALGGLALLGGCGGGSGAPNNPFAPGAPIPGPVFVLPANATVYSNTPTTLTITGGVAPYFVVSSNTAILPVAATSTGTIVLLPANVASDTVVLITVRDSVGTSASATVTVKAAPIFNTLTIKPSSSACGTNTICSGQTGTVSVTVTGPGGVGLPGRQVKFDVIDGDFGIQSNNPATPIVQTLTVVSDGNGVALVVIQANFGAATQPATIRATELTTGNAVNGQFTIVQPTALSVVPKDASVTAGDNTGCVVGFRVDYRVFGGTPPYSASASAPNAVTLLNAINIPFGGAFSAITNGTCLNPLVLTIVDATGQTTTATLESLLGPAPPVVPTPPSSVSASPGKIDVHTDVAGCTGKTFQVVVSGGTPPYNVSATGSFDGSKPVPTFNPASGILPTPGAISISGLMDGLGSAGITPRNEYDFIVLDSASTNDTFKIICTP